MKPDPVSAPAAAPGEPQDAAAAALSRRLGLFDMTMLVMGSVIGAGIFVVPHDVAKLVGTPRLILAAWVLGGVITLTGSLVYAELTWRRPHVGGQYAFLREAYHPLVAFLYGWSLLWIIQSGGMASVAVVFGRYAVELLHLLGSGLETEGPFGILAGMLHAAADAPQAEMLLAAGAIAVLTLINCTGVRAGGTTQNIFMALKLLAILTMVLAGLLVADAVWSLADGTAAATGGDSAGTGPAGWTLATALAAALVPVLFAYGGSHTTTFMAGEVRDPRRTLPRGLILGVSGVVLVYLAVNVASLRVLGAEGLARTPQPASEVMHRALGAPGAAVLSAGIAISALGFLSQATLTSPRVYYTMACDGLFFRAVGWVHPRSRVPVAAVLLQGAFAAVIAVTGTFHQILNYVMSAEMVFFALTGMSLFVIRRRDARTAGAMAPPLSGHPWTTLLFAVVNVALVADLFYEYPLNSVLGLGIALAGVPVYAFWRWRARRPATEPGPA
jgi:APA family basic amino acid/polyamine antiporter